MAPSERERQEFIARSRNAGTPFARAEIAHRHPASVTRGGRRHARDRIGVRDAFIAGGIVAGIVGVLALLLWLAG